MAGGLDRPKRRKWDHTDSRGASLVEMALVLPLLLMLLMGIVSAGLAYYHQIGLTHAAREAARYGATLPVDNFASMNNWLAAVEARAMEAATGSLAPGTPGALICVAYVHPNGADPSDQTAKIENGSVTPGATCFSDGRPNDERRVQVHVIRDVDFNVLVFNTTLTIDSEGVSRFEASLGL